MTMHHLYPSIRPYVSHSLAVDPPHVLYMEECGNPQGLPVVFLHGGPGAGCEPYHRQFFNPEVYRIVLFDQRGSGRSMPHAEVMANTTQALVSDIERVREHLKIDRWVVFGGSWGSTLALVYAETYPQRMLGLIVRGIFLARPQEIRWFYQEGASRLFPDYWADFVSPIPAAERGDLLRAFHARLMGDDEVARMAAAKAWALWEARTSMLQSRQEVVEHLAQPYTAISMARLEAHYCINQCFLAPNQILDQASRLHGIPGTIVHGRYDVICPLDNAWELHKAWPEADLKVIPDAGHSASEPGILDALVQATMTMAKRYR
jgi:proline iminopeptidase